MDLSLSSAIHTNHAGSNNGCNCYASVSQGSQSISGNTTKINYSMSAVYYCSPGYTWGGASRYNNGYFDLLIDGKTVATINLNTINGWGNGTKIGSKSGSYTVTHNGDGTKSVSVQIRINSGSDPQLGGVYYNAATGGAQTLTLTTIPRTSNVSLNTSTIECNGSNRFTIYTNRKSTAFTHTITYGFGSTSGTIATGVGDSCTWTPNKSLLSQIPNAQAGWGRITCTTYNGSTQIGQSFVDFTLTAGSTSKPVITSFTITEQTSIVSQKAGANATMALLSNKLVRVTEHTVDGATTSSVFITNNGKRVQLQQTGMQGGDAVLTGYISAVTSGTYTVTVNDTRGLSASTTISQTFYNYTYPTIAAAGFGRATATGSDGTLTANGKYANMLSNTVTIQVTRTGLSTATITGTKSNGSWNFSKSYSDLTYTSSYTATIKITDSFGQSAALNVVLGKSLPTLWLGKTNVKLANGSHYGPPVVSNEGHSISFEWKNGYISVIVDVTEVFRIPEVGAKSVLEKAYPVGSIYISAVSTNPNVLFGFGTWQRIEGRFLLGASSTYGAGTQGGEEKHILTVNEMPVHNHWYAKLPDGTETYSWGWGNGHRTNVYMNTETVAGTPPANSPVTQQGSAHSTVNAGGGWSHNNMPPYLAVYIWKRTA